MPAKPESGQMGTVTHLPPKSKASARRAQLSWRRAAAQNPPCLPPPTQAGAVPSAMPCCAAQAAPAPAPTCSLYFSRIACCMFFSSCSSLISVSCSRHWSSSSFRFCRWTDRQTARVDRTTPPISLPQAATKAPAPAPCWSALATTPTYRPTMPPNVTASHPPHPCSPPASRTRPRFPTPPAPGPHSRCWLLFNNHMHPSFSATSTPPACSHPAGLPRPRSHARARAAPPVA